MLEEANLLDDEEESASKSWGSSMELNGTTYATSLFWQPLQNASDPFQEVEEASAGVLDGADLFCIKNGKSPQFGVCASRDGYKSGENVAAAALATAMSDVGSYVGVFKTGQGWWYICVRNDIILSDGDMLFFNEEDAKEQFLSMLAVPDWGKKIAPQEWEIEGTEEIDLAATIGQGAKAKLQKIKALRGWKLFAVIAATAIVGIWLTSSIVDKLFLTPTVRPVVVPIRPKALPKAAEPVVEILPWEKVPSPQDVMKECYTAIMNLNGILPPGWTIGNITCSKNGAATSWNRSLGRISFAQKALDSSGLEFTGYSFSSNGNSLTATVPLPKVKENNSPPQKTFADMQNELNDLFQSIGVAISIAKGTTKSSTGKVYNMLSFSINSEYNPLIWSDLLTKYSGLDIRIITYSPSSNIWHYEGTIYVL